ncbi:YndJ family transporter [Kribbella sp. NPDC051936]|uniref:YndJ family transporter n=1 Tax=Kribbella sp. NPDC051936 TaxID=3154946 RepID=UPI00343CE740
MWLVGWNLWRRSRRTDRTTGVLLVVSGSVLVLTMLLAVSWALGHVVDTPYLPLEWMVATHGWRMRLASGCAVCWRCDGKEPDEAGGSGKVAVHVRRGGLHGVRRDARGLSPAGVPGADRRGGRGVPAGC